MRQEAPEPDALYDLVACLEYRPGWKFTLEDIDRGQGSAGLTLVITTLGYNSYHIDRGESYKVHHYMPVSPAAYDERSWQHWLFEQILLVERHEAMEFFKLRTETGDVRPYAPSHGPGNNPYIVREFSDDIDQRMSFRGELNMLCVKMTNYTGTHCSHCDDPDSALHDNPDYAQAEVDCAFYDDPVHLTVAGAGRKRISPRMRRFQVYRPSPPDGYRESGAANAPDEVQFEGVVFSDGTVAVRWLTASRSHSVWNSLKDLKQIHGHPEYGTVWKWLDD